jgi:adenylate cyclase
MMVIFGAPVDDPYQEEHAVFAAVEMQKELRNLCDQWQANGRRPTKMGIGINPPPRLSGTSGPRITWNKRQIGDTVNLAARLESATKELGLDIAVSEHTCAAIRRLFQWKPVTIAVRRRSELVRAYSVEGENDKLGIPDA